MAFSDLSMIFAAFYLLCQELFERVPQCVHFITVHHYLTGDPDAGHGIDLNNSGNIPHLDRYHTDMIRIRLQRNH